MWFLDVKTIKMAESNEGDQNDGAQEGAQTEGEQKERNQPKVISAEAIFAVMDLPVVRGEDYMYLAGDTGRPFIPNPLLGDERVAFSGFLERQSAAREAFETQQRDELSAFIRAQRIRRLGLAEDASDADISEREYAIDLAQKACKMKATLLRFIRSVRDQTAEGWDGEDMVKGLFEDRPNIGLGGDILHGLPDEVKDRVIGEVLAETGFTRDEATRCLSGQIFAVKRAVSRTLQRGGGVPLRKRSGRTSG